MANTFVILLTLVTLVTGLFWCLDKFVWGIKRQRQVEKVRAETNGHIDGNELAKIGRPPKWIESVSSFFPVLAVVLVIRSFIYEPFQIPSGSMMPTLLIGDFIVVEKFAYGLREPITNRVLIKTGSPKRGDAAVFKYPRDPKVDYIKRVVGLPGDRVKYNLEERLLTIIPKCEPVKESCQPNPVDLHYTPIELSDFTQTFDLLTMRSVFEKGKKDEELALSANQKAFRLLTRQETLGKYTHSILLFPEQLSSLDDYYRQPGQARNEWVVPEGHYFMMGDNRDNSEDSRYWGFVPESYLVGRATAIWMSFDKQQDEWPTGIRFNQIGRIR